MLWQCVPTTSRSVDLHIFINYSDGNSDRCLVQLVEHYNAPGRLVDGYHDCWTSHAYSCGCDGHTGSELSVIGMRISHCYRGNRIST